MSHDRYSDDVLAGDWRRPPRGRSQEVAAEPGLVVEDVETGWCGAVVHVEKAGGVHVVHLEDRHGRQRGFPLGPGFLLDGMPVVLTPPVAAAGAALAQARAAAARTASGSVAVPDSRARVASGSRIWVEGKHDAELVEKVWGHDLRVEGIVVEPLHGADDLVAAVQAFGPGPDARLGVLLDHLVPGSKETRLADEVTRRWAPHVAVLGHPYVDVWAAVRPERVGLRAWPEVPRGQDWKTGVMAATGWPDDVPAAWARILGSVRSYADLEPALLARVEALVDHLTTSPTTPPRG